MLDRLLKKDGFLVIWCIIAAFGVYFCTYAFRKPFNAGVYESYLLFGINYKTVLIISQMAGYVISKFTGIKLISELKRQRRIPLAIGLIAFAEFSLLLFGIVPAPYNFICMFFNGLPLGLMFGIVFSFLEGRRFTELLSLGLSISMIIGSGMLKSVYFVIRNALLISEFWLPAAEGFLFLIPFLLFVWMLSKIPEQTEADMKQRVKREPMTKKEKGTLIVAYGTGIFCIVAINALLTVCRDFRDDFMVEITREIGISGSTGIFSKIESGIGIFVLLVVGLLSFIRSNKKSFLAMHLIILLGLLLLLSSSIAYNSGAISPMLWFICVGCGIFLSYIVIQSVYFDRFIALFKLRANAGFLIYISDSAGYAGTIFILCYKEFFASSTSWGQVLIYLSMGVAVVGMIALCAGSVFFLIQSQKRDIRMLYMKRLRKIINNNNPQESVLA